MKRSNLTKHQVLHWFGACLHGNITRKKVIELFLFGVIMFNLTKMLCLQVLIKIMLHVHSYADSI